MVEVRWSAEPDCTSLAALHREAWRYAYAGIIPGPALERMVARRGPRWWRAMHAGGGTALVLELGPSEVAVPPLVAHNAARGGRAPASGLAGCKVAPVAGLAGYATIGRARGRDRRTGEIYELYLRPDCQGIGFGRHLFESARARLSLLGLRHLVVWSLAENGAACRFYRAMGGTESVRSHDRIGGVTLEKIGFTWR